MNTQTAERPTRVGDFADEQTAHSPPAVLTTDHPEPRPRVDLPQTGFGKLAEAIAGVMAEIRPVEKLGFNKFHGYTHARIGDLNAELTPLMGKHGIVVFQNEVDRNMFDGGNVVAVRYEFTIIHKSGEIWPERPLITGMSRCRNTKDGFDDKAFNKAHTAARKYFLIGLFQIPVEDADEADNHDSGNGGERAGPARPTKRPPSPDGKATPALLPIIDGELPPAWAARFIKAIADADSPATIQKWYQANLAIFEKMKKHPDGPDVYNSLVDAMDAREAALANVGKTAKEADPISSGPTDTHTSSGTRRPPRNKRLPPPPPAEDQPATDGKLFTTEEEDWFKSLENAFSGCEDVTVLAEKQNEYMTPKKSEVSEAAWREATAIVRRELARIEGNPT